MGGEVFKLDGNSLSTFIAEGVGGLDFDKHIRFSQGNFYINNVLGVETGSDQIDEVLLFNSSGIFIRRILDETDVEALLFKDIAVNAQGQLYVAPTAFSEDIAIRIDANGQNRNTIIRSGDGGVFVSTSLAIDLNGNLYVGSPSRVSKFDSNGNFLKKIIEEGINGFDYAANLAVDRGNNLYVGNENLTNITFNVLRFDSDGNFLGEFIEPGAAGLSDSVDDMAFDIQGRLYIADNIGVDGIVRFDQSGNFDRVGVKNFESLSSSLIVSSEKSRTINERQRHYRELKLKDKILAEEFAKRNSSAK